MNNEAKKDRITVKQLYIIIAVLSFLEVLLLVIHFSSPIQDKGGIIGGIFGGLITTIATVLIYIRLFKQNEDIAEKQKRASELEKFETKFMMMINIHRENVKQMSLNKKDYRFRGSSREREIRGQECFEVMVEELKAIFKQQKVKVPNENDVDKKKKVLKDCYHTFFYGLLNIPQRYLCNETECFILKNLKKEYVNENLGVASLCDIDQSLYHYNAFKGYQTQLGHYFRHLWQTVNFVHSYAGFMTFEEREPYMKMLRAQLSNDEQVILALNALSDLGKPWIKVLEGGEKGLLEKYELIKNIPEEFFDERENLNLIDCFPKMRFEYRE